MRITNKHEDYPSTPILQPLVVVDVYEQKFTFKDGTPAEQYIQTLEFYTNEEFEEYLSVNGIKEGVL